jgi:hypothetical protein
MPFLLSYGYLFFAVGWFGGYGGELKIMKNDECEESFRISS